MEVYKGMYLPFFASISPTRSLIDATAPQLDATAVTTIPDVQIISVEPVRAASVCLPYALIPDMDINSSAFQKAVTVLGKQQLKPPASPSSSSIIPGRFKRAKLDHLSSLQDLSKAFLSSLLIICLFVFDRLFTGSPSHQ